MRGDSSVSPGGRVQEEDVVCFRYVDTDSLAWKSLPTRRSDGPEMDPYKQLGSLVDEIPKGYFIKVIPPEFKSRCRLSRLGTG